MLADFFIHSPSEPDGVLFGHGAVFCELLEEFEVGELFLECVPRDCAPVDDVLLVHATFEVVGDLDGDGGHTTQKTV